MSIHHLPVDVIRCDIVQAHDLASETDIEYQILAAETDIMSDVKGSY